MKDLLIRLFKGGIGLIYTSLLFIGLYMGLVWLTQFVIQLSWTGAILFWLIGIPIAIGLFQMLSTVVAIPAVLLMKGTGWISLLLLLPGLYTLFCYGRFLWTIAHSIGGVLVWLLAVSWFFETAYLFVAYLKLSIEAAFAGYQDLLKNYE